MNKKCISVLTVLAWFVLLFSSVMPVLGMEIGTSVTITVEGFYISSQTEDFTLDVGEDQQLKVVTSGAVETYTWEVSTDGGTAWAAAPQATNAAVYDIIDAQLNRDAAGKDIAYQYRITVTNVLDMTDSTIISVLVSDDYEYRTVSLRESEAEVSAYLHDDTRLVVSSVEETTPAVTALEQELAEDCLPLLICDVSLVNQDDEVVPYFGTLQVNFNVGPEYNGMTLRAFHLHDNVIDTYSGVVADGILSITVNTLSPFMVEVPEVTAHTITASAGANGSISPGGTVNVADGASKTFTFLPAAGYAVDTVLVNNAPVSFTGNSYTLTDVRADASISVSFRAVAPSAELHTITVTSGAHGSVSPSGAVQVRHGDPQTFYFYPESGYELDKLLMNGQEVKVLGSSLTLSAVETDLTVQASFRQASSQPPDVYKVITASSGAGGQISPAGEVSVEYGGGMYFYFIPDEGYEVAEVTVDGAVTAVSGNSYQFVNVIAAHTINVTFRETAPPQPTYYKITASVSGTGGTVSPAGEVQVAAGGSQKFTFTPDAGFELDAVLVDGLAVVPTYETAAAGSAGTSGAAGDSGTTGVSGAAAGASGAAWYEFTNVSADHTIAVSFKEAAAPPPSFYTITASAGTGGSISPSGAVQVAAGGSQTFLFVPDADYEVDTVTVDGTALDLTGGAGFSSASGASGTEGTAATSYTFNAVAADHTIHVTFKEKVTPPPPVFYTITASAGAGGSISPEGAVSVPEGGSQIFYFIADENFEVDAVTVDGIAVDLSEGAGSAGASGTAATAGTSGTAGTAATSYTFDNVAADHTIHVAFKEKVTPPPPVLYTITASAGVGGSISPAGAVSVPEGGSQIFYFIADENFEVDAVTVDGTAVDLTGGAGSAGASGTAGAAGTSGTAGTAATSYTFDNVAADHTIHVAFKEKVTPPPVLYTITASAGTNGSISPDGAVQVAEGASQTFNFLPDAGYEVDTVMVDSAAVAVSGTLYQFSNVTANHVIMVSFKKTVAPPEPVVYYTITASAGADGSISPDGAVQVAEGASQMFSFIAEDGYEVDTVTVDGQAVTVSGTSYQFSNVAADHTIAVAFKKVVTPPEPVVYYTITASAGANGSISPSGAVQVAKGESQTFNFIAAAGYEVDTVTVDGQAVTVSGTSYQFSNVTADHTIAVAFKKVVTPPEPVVYYTITASAGANGSISPDGAVQVAKGESQTFNFIAAAGYEVDTVRVDGKKVDLTGASAAAGASDASGASGAAGASYASSAAGASGASSYTFSNVAADHTIHVAFKKAVKPPCPEVRYTIIACSGAHGYISPRGCVQVARGGSQTFYFVPDKGYEVAKVIVDGKLVSVSAATLSYEFADVRLGHRILVLFRPSAAPPEPVEYYTIKAGAGAHGSISPAGRVQVAAGGSQTFWFMPYKGYEVDEVIVDGQPVLVSAAVGGAGAAAESGISGAVDAGAAGSVGSVVSTGATGSAVAADAQSAAGVSGMASSGNSYQFTNVAANHTIKVTFRRIAAPPKPVERFTIEASAGEHGRISPAGSVLVAAGAAQTFYLLPDRGYEVDTLTVDGKTAQAAAVTGNAAAYRFTEVAADHSLQVTFKKSVTPHCPVAYFTVQASAGAHGCITPKGCVRLVRGSDACFYFIPERGYEVAEVLLDGKQVAAQSVAEYAAEFAAHNSAETAVQDAEQFAVHTSAQSAVQSSAESAVQVADQSAANSAAQSAVRASFYWLENIAANHSLRVTFRRIEAAPHPVVYHKITASCDGNGVVSPSDEVWAADGGSQTFYFIPRSGYEVAAIYVDGQKQDVVSSCYTVENVTADVELRVEFKRAGFLPGTYDGNCLWGHLFGTCVVCESVEHYTAPWCWVITLVLLAALGGAGWYWRRSRRK